MLLKGKTFERCYDRESGVIISGIELCKCCFISSRLSQTLDPARRSIVRNVTATACEVNCSFVDTAVLEHVVINGLKTHAQPPFMTWGAVFKHVTLKGSIDDVVLNSRISNWRKRPEAQAAFENANAAYYAEVDWALDIREAAFKEISIRSVPARLICRDTETQAVVLREKALEVNWKATETDGWKNIVVRNSKVDLSKTWWPSAIQYMLDDGRSDVVLVAPKRNRKYHELLDGVKMLRDVGVAESS